MPRSLLLVLSPDWSVEARKAPLTAYGRKMMDDLPNAGFAKMIACLYVVKKLFETYQFTSD